MDGFQQSITTSRSRRANFRCSAVRAPTLHTPILQNQCDWRTGSLPRNWSFPGREIPTKQCIRRIGIRSLGVGGEKRSISLEKRIAGQDDDRPWRPFTPNRSARAGLKLTDLFELYLRDLGSTVIHKTKGLLKLDDIYVYPDCTVRTMTANEPLELKGDAIFQYVAKTSKILFQGAASHGRAALAKVLFRQLYNNHFVLPLLLDAKGLKIASDKKVTNHLWNLAEAQYGTSSSESYRTLKADQRVLIIDDWHQSLLNGEGRRAFLEVASQYFGKIVLFTDDLYQVQEIADKSTEVMIEFEHVVIQQLSHFQRGRLVDKWLMLGREHTATPLSLARETEETEKYLQSVIGKNTLPSLPFIILCILQVKQEEKPESPEAGSYGYLYEVLVTKALNSTVSRKPQLEKKYVFLSLLAYRMFKEKQASLSNDAVRRLAEEYAESFQVDVDVDSMLTDLTKGRVLDNSRGNFSFVHPHLFHYFVARYYKENLGREHGDKLRDELFTMVDNISWNRDSTVLMFVLYFARDSARLVDKLVTNAGRIYQDQAQATLDKEVDFLSGDEEAPEEIELPEEVNLEENRAQRRNYRDEIVRTHPQGEEDGYEYSENLSDSRN